MGGRLGIGVGGSVGVAIGRGIGDCDEFEDFMTLWIRCGTGNVNHCG
jgi:hypothetical protein